MRKWGRWLKNSAWGSAVRQATGMTSMFLCQGKRRKDLLSTPSFLPQACSQSKGFSHEWWIGLGAADRANSLKFKAHCSLCRLGGCRKLPETCSGCVALCHKQLFQPGCDSAAQRTAHWAVLALHKQGHRLGVVTSGKGQDDINLGKH